MGPIWGRQDLGGLHVGPMNFAIWVLFLVYAATEFANSGYKCLTIGSFINNDVVPVIDLPHSFEMQDNA